MHARSLEFAATATPNHIPRKGSLVRTIHAGPDGVHRAEVTAVFARDGVEWAAVGGKDLPFSALEVIRGPAGIQRHASSGAGGGFRN
jgi:hypothetical protein